MIDSAYVWVSIAIIALITALLRFIPFLIFGNGKKAPKMIEKLSFLLPPAIMGMLVIYCLRSTSLSSLGGFLPTVISCATVILLHVWKRNTLLSIMCGTLSYMLLVQFVF